MIKQYTRDRSPLLPPVSSPVPFYFSPRLFYNVSLFSGHAGSRCSLSDKLPVSVSEQPSCYRFRFPEGVLSNLDGEHVSTFSVENFSFFHLATLVVSRATRIYITQFRAETRFHFLKQLEFKWPNSLRAFLPFMGK